MAMNVSPLAGKPSEPWMLVNIPRLITAYHTECPDPAVPEQRVAFGTSGHRRSAFDRAFNEAHILAVSQAICEYRQRQQIDGPLFLGMDTHAILTSKRGRHTGLADGIVMTPSHNPPQEDS
jgi:phosphoglucomutase